MSRHVLLLAPLLGALLLPASASAGCSEAVEISVDHMGGLEDELLRVADLVGATPGTTPRLIRRGGPRRESVCAATLVSTPFERFARDVVPADRPVEVGALPLRLGTVWNTLRPSGDRDGLLWAGRGVSQLLSGGASLRAGPLSVTLAPEVSWSENHAFPAPSTGRTGRQRFANPFYPDALDLPQRFGAGPFVTWGPGQSSVRLERWNAAAGLSTENLWIGSGIRSSIVLTNTGPGFPHAFLGTARPIDVWIGHVEALVFWGRLERSRYAYVGGHPLLEGLAVTYTPRWVPGLSVGAGRLYLQRWDDLRVRDWLGIFQSFQKKDLESRFGPGGDNPFDNQLLSLFGRWVFPESGVELYGEWAREDHERDLYGFIHEPDHTQAYLLGLQKVFRVPSGLLRVHAEVAHLQEIRPLESQRGMQVYYIHHDGLDFTNRGQLLGAGIGPGGSSQTVAVDLYRRGGRIGGYLERIVRNDAYYWENVEPTKPGGRDVELLAGVRQVLALGPVEAAWDLSFGRRWNRDFLGPTEDNLRVTLELRVPLGGGTRARVAAATAPASGR